LAVKAPVIAGKYKLLRKLGAGGMAEVFLAKQASEGNFEKLVVIKRILPHLAQGDSNGDFVRMFLDEARLASDLRHPNIVTVIDVGKTSESYFIVMEFLHGQDVRKMQRKNAAWGEQIPLGHCAQIAIDAAAGLHYAHKKTDMNGRALTIVHRDVSPQNIIVTYEGGTKIVDFGIAKAATQTTHTSTGVLKGKYTYMSPEQAAGEIVDARTDQFALGIVLWELLTMRRLFKRDSEMATLEAIMGGVIPKPSRFREDIPKAIDDVVMRALARDKRDRFPDCEALALALEDACAKEQIVHSTNRLSQYMRRLFADTLAEEATLGLVNPDGSLSRNLTPFTLPPPEENKQVREPEQVFERAPEKPGRSEKQPPSDMTTADRKSARSSRDDTASKRKKPVESRPPIEPESPKSVVTESDPTEPTVVEEARKPRAIERHDRDRPRSRNRDPDRDRLSRSRDRDVVDRDVVDRDEGTRPMAAALGVGLAAAALVVVLYGAYAWWSSGGPATLVIRSEPKGAAVILDGKPTGQTTPALLHDVEAGTPHKVRLELGDKDVEEIVTIERRNSTYELKLDFK
jgi:serine/threonine-protein kinase